jgi:ribosomal protein S18 acetylase RimI-like enzyme
MSTGEAHALQGAGAYRALADRGVMLRSVVDDDLPWLRDLYATTREDEMAQVPWSAAQKRAFLDQQFGAQHQHYRAAYPGADVLVVFDADGPLGRFYLQRSPPDHLVVDISLFPRARGQGIGGALIRAAQEDAAVQGRGMTLHVLQQNPAARRLYERLGFVASEAPFPYLRMAWQPTGGLIS